MNPRKIRPDIDREEAILQKIITKLKSLNWYVKRTHGNEFQSGWPDLFCAHIRYGVRWIEVKRPDYQSFTEAQLKYFPLFSNNGAPIWILTSEDDFEINKLFKYNNWWSYLQVNKYRTSYRGKQLKEPKPSKIPMKGEEWKIQEETQRILESQGWFVRNTSGDIFTYGFPDQLATHKRWGQRWIEYKNTHGYNFTPAQLDTFPMMQAHGVGVWIFTDSSQTDRLFRAANWRDYLC